MEEHGRKQLRVFSFEQHIILSFTRGIHRTMKKLFALAAVLALLVSASAFAGTFTLPKAGIDFTLPDSWQPSDSKLGTMFVSPGSDMVIFFGETNSEAGLDGAMELVEQVVSEVLTDIELGEDTEHDINGIQVSGVPAGESVSPSGQIQQPITSETITLAVTATLAEAITVPTVPGAGGGAAPGGPGGMGPEEMMPGAPGMGPGPGEPGMGPGPGGPPPPDADPGGAGDV